MFEFDACDGNRGMWFLIHLSVVVSLACETFNAHESHEHGVGKKYE